MRIPFEVDMDETAVQEAREYCARTDSAVGHAGRACKSRCKTKREHKKRTMQGMCSGDMPPDTMEPFVIGTGSGAYTRIVKYAETYRCASMISLIVINPRHLNLESVAVGILPTTNTFTAEDSANLYKKIETLLANSPQMKEFGDCYGYSSDGDKRRATTGMNAMTSTAATEGLKVEGFLYLATVKKEGTRTTWTGIHNQDLHKQLPCILSDLSMDLSTSSYPSFTLRPALPPLHTGSHTVHLHRQKIKN